MSGIRVDPGTGEVLEDAPGPGPANPAVPDTSLLAAEYVRASEALKEAEAEAEEMRGHVDRLRAAILATVPVGEGVHTTTHVVVVEPPARRPAQRVNAAACETHQEVLTDLGLGKRVTVYKPPTIAELRGATAEVIARGIRWNDLIVDPGPGQPVVKVLEKGDRP